MKGVQMCMFKVLPIAIPMLLASCGSYSINKTRDLERRDKQKHELEAANFEATNKAEQFQNFLRNLRKTDEFMYVAVSFRDHEHLNQIELAKQDCEEIGFVLPNDREAERIDFKADDGRPIAVVTEDGSEANLVVCVKRS